MQRTRRPGWSAAEARWRDEVPPLRERSGRSSNPDAAHRLHPPTRASEPDADGKRHSEHNPGSLGKDPVDP
ncbi:hypothetical protein, partial [Streptomyces sp. NPDC050388]|uniref:hypothetical protein n=1 Tax=Streptomyces sp. NPDC050388 TaxID=3155781 RepID=UPI003425806D